MASGYEKRRQIRGGSGVSGKIEHVTNYSISPKALSSLVSFAVSIGFTR
jgi:hypothetical protein